MDMDTLTSLYHVQRVTLACGLKTPRRSRAELARVWVVSQPVSELVEEPGQAPRLGSGGTKPQAEVSRWRSRSSAPLPRPVPPCRGRRRLARSTTAAVVIVGSGEPAAAKLATPSASSSAPSWGEEDGGVEPSAATAAQRCCQIHHHCYSTPPPDPPPLPAATRARAPPMGNSRRRGKGRSRLTAERGGEKPSRTGEGRGEAGELRR
jgi:hypothetical protein